MAHPYRHRYILCVHVCLSCLLNIIQRLTGCLPDSQTWDPSCLWLYSKGGVGSWPQDPLILSHTASPPSRRSWPQKTAIWRHGWSTSLEATLWKSRVLSLKMQYICIKSRPLYDTVSAIEKIHESGKWGVAAGVAPLTITPSDPWKCCP